MQCQSSTDISNIEGPGIDKKVMPVIFMENKKRVFLCYSRKVHFLDEDLGNTVLNLTEMTDSGTKLAIAW